MQLDPRFAENYYTDKSELKLIVEKDVNSEDIQDLLSDDYAKSILESIKTGPKSTLQLCEELKIPPSTAYRIMQKLYHHKLIKRTFTINGAGVRVSLYKIRFGEAQCQ